MAREKSNVGQWMQELPLEMQREFAERGPCTLISSEQCILLLVTDGVQGPELLPRWLSGQLGLSHSPAC